jgi:AraC-like DNA-binding protein
MKLALESISPNESSSFKLIVNPRLSDFFFWHFHPELELVYIEGATGTRHVGDHISVYHESDLVLIGSNIPHLNFDYRVKTDYQKMVIHIRANFLQYADGITPELEKVKQLLRNSAKGIAFGEKTKTLLKERIKAIHTFNEFDRFLELLSIFNLLANAEDTTFLHVSDFANKFSKKEHERLNRIYTFVEQSYNRSISLEEVAELSNYSKAAFCRFFKRMTKLTFVEFLNNYRINQAKRYLLAGKNVTEAAGLCGYESLSYFNRVFKRITSENPISFKNNHTIT